MTSVTGDLREALSRKGYYSAHDGIEGVLSPSEDPIQKDNIGAHTLRMLHTDGGSVDEVRYVVVPGLSETCNVFLGMEIRPFPSLNGFDFVAAFPWKYLVRRLNDIFIRGEVALPCSDDDIRIIRSRVKPSHYGLFVRELEE